MADNAHFKASLLFNAQWAKGRRRNTREFYYMFTPNCRAFIWRMVPDGGRTGSTDRSASRCRRMPGLQQRTTERKCRNIGSTPLGLGSLKRRCRVELFTDSGIGTMVTKESTAAVLSDVHPDGAATQITYGLLNLTHRESHEIPQPLKPGKSYRVTIQLNEIGHHFHRGHRIRLALSNAYWPLVWPSPESVASRRVGDEPRVRFDQPLKVHDRGIQLSIFAVECRVGKVVDDDVWIDAMSFD